MHTRAIWPLSAALIIAGCAPHITGSGRPPQSLADQTVYYDTQTILGRCHSPDESAILATVASAVIATGMNRIGDAIRAAADSETRVVLARRNIELRKGQQIGPCVTVARGWFHRNHAAGSTLDFAANPKSAFIYRTAGEVAALRRAGLALAATPDFFFQGQIVAATDGSAYTIAPLMASLDEPISSTPLRPSGNRSVLVSFAFSDVGKAADLQKGGGSTITLGKMEPGKFVEYTGRSCIAGVTGKVVTPLTLCPAADSFDIIVRSPMDSEWFSMALTDKGKPMMLQAMVSETRSASQFLGFVSDVFGATKGSLTSELQRTLIPSVAAAAEETEQTAVEKANNDADTALAKAINDLNACAGAPSDAAKRISARTSLRSYIQAARKAERGIGATDAHVAAIKVGGTEAASCTAALSAIMTI